MCFLTTSQRRVRSLVQCEVSCSAQRFDAATRATAHLRPVEGVAEADGAWVKMHLCARHGTAVARLNAMAARGVGGSSIEGYRTIPSNPTQDPIETSMEKCKREKRKVHMNLLWPGVTAGTIYRYRDFVGCLP